MHAFCKNTLAGLTRLLLGWIALSSAGLALASAPTARRSPPEPADTLSVRPSTTSVCTASRTSGIPARAG